MSYSFLLPPQSFTVPFRLLHLKTVPFSATTVPPKKSFFCFRTWPATTNSPQITQSNILSLGKKTERLCSPKEVSSSTEQGDIKFVGENKQEANLDFDKRNSRLQSHELVNRIRALETTQRTRIVDFLETDGEFQTIADFNNLLMALVELDELELALDLFSTVSSYGPAPNCWTYSVIIRCYCKKNEPSEAKRIADHMLDIGFQPDIATFTVLINAFCTVGRVQKAMEVMKIMARVKCQPTIQTYNCLLKGFCYLGQVEKACEILQNLKKSPIKPNIYTYNAVMDGFGKVGRSGEASELFVEALERGLIPTVATFNALFTGYWKEGRPLEGIGLLKQMKDRNCTPDYVSYCTLLHGLLKWREIHAALRIYKEMVGIGFLVDERMMNTLLRALCRRSRTEEWLLKDAYEVFERMSKWAFVIYGSTYDLVIEAFCLGGRADEALVNLHKMAEVGYAPNTITFDNVIRALCVEGNVEKAVSILVMYQGREVPNRVSFNVLINEFNRQGSQLSARNVYGAALKIGVVPKRKPRGYSQAYQAREHKLHNPLEQKA